MMLIFKKDGKEHLVRSFLELGRTWKSLPFEVERVGQIHQIVNGQFDNDSGYEFYIEQDIMKELDLDYVVEMRGDGNTEKMVTKRKAELLKNINLRGLNTYGCKISKVRTMKQVENEGACKLRDRALFQVSVRSGDGTWYTKCGENYSVTSLNAIKENS